MITGCARGSKLPWPLPCRMVTTTYEWDCHQLLTSGATRLARNSGASSAGIAGLAIEAVSGI